MKLLFVIDSLNSGGAQRQMVTLALGMNQRGHQIEFFVYHPRFRHFAGELEAVGIPIHACRKRHKLSPTAPLHILRLITAGAYDAVLAFLDTPNLYCEFMRWGRPSTPVVVSERFMYVPGRMSPWKWLSQQCHRLASHITVNSHHQRERMVQRFPWMKPKITTVYNGVNLAVFYPRDEGGATSSAGPPSFLSIATVARKKNADGLIRALAHFRNKHGECPTIAWAGKNRTRDADYFGECEQLLQEHDLTEHWIWLGDRSDIPELIPQYDAVIHPSFLEGFANSICEGLAVGKPVLAGNVCDHARLITDGENGYLFDPASPEDIANAMERFWALSNTARVEMGRCARQVAGSTFSQDQFVDHYEQLFLSLSGRAGDR